MLKKTALFLSDGFPKDFAGKRVKKSKHEQEPYLDLVKTPLSLNTF